MKSSKPIYLLLLIFIVPMIISWGLFHYHKYFQFKTVNHGTLINPPLDVTELYHNMPNGKEKKWRILQIDNGSCDNQCQEINHQLHQVQKALGKDQNRVLVILMNANDVASTHILPYSEEKIKNQIYLIDPRGFLFMVYSNNINFMDILKDIKKVLEVSQIG